MANVPIGEITAVCERCGSREMAYDPDGGDNAIITCATCNTELGTVSDFNAEAEIAARQALPDIEAALKKALKF